MTASEIMDSLSDSLLCDERILSVQERELLANLLQRAKTNENGGDGVITETIARSVGEIVAQRAYGVLGESITRRLAHSLGGSDRLTSAALRSNTMPTPKPAPFPPGPNPPGPHGIAGGLQVHLESVAVAEIPEVLPAECVILEEFLAPAELDALRQYVFDHEADFQLSEVISPGSPAESWTMNTAGRACF
jgi:hypothetical protein